MKRGKIAKTTIRQTRGNRDATHREISSISRENYSAGDKVSNIPTVKPSIRDVGRDGCLLIIIIIIIILHFIWSEGIGSSEQAFPLSLNQCFLCTFLCGPHRTLQSTSDYTTILS